MKIQKLYPGGLRKTYRSFAPLLLLFVLFGCATTPLDEQWSEFTRSINFTHYDTFSIFPVEMNVRGRQTSGILADFRAASEGGAIAALEELGFEQVAEDPDFKIRIIWSDLITDSHRDWLEGQSSWREPISFHFDEGRDAGQDERIYAIIEVSDADTENVFWRSPIRSQNSVRSLHAEPAAVVIERILSRFPPRVVTDPNLPDIE